MTTCPICLEDIIKDINTYKSKVCTHVFHSECIKIWLNKNRTCPMCRAIMYLPSNVVYELFSYCVDGDLNSIRNILQLYPEKINDAFSWVCHVGHYDIVRHFVEIERVNIGYGNYLGLRWAVEKGHFEIVVYILLFVSAAAAEESIINTLVRIAAQHGKLEVLKYLVEIKGGDITANYDNALLLASSFGHMHVVKYLIEKGSKRILSATKAACFSGDLEMVKYLLSIENDNTGIILDIACMEGHLHIVEYLVKDGHVPNTKGFIWAAECGRLSVVKYLLEKECINLQAAGISRALMGAIRRRRLDIVRCLVNSGLKPNSRALDCAQSEGYEDIVNYLLNY